MFVVTQSVTRNLLRHCGAHRPFDGSDDVPRCEPVGPSLVASGRRRALHRRGVLCSPRRFNQYVADACESLPARYRTLLHNVAITVEERPSPALEMEGGALGLYEGTPLGERGISYSIAMPDKITIYRAPLLAECSSLAELREEVRLTLLHEIGHYFGMTDDELPF